MLKKGPLLLFILLFVLVIGTFGVIADEHDELKDSIIENEKGSIDKGYACLRGQIEDRSISLEEAIFSALALGGDSKLIDVIEKKKESGRDCWPDNNCNVKETAQVLLAYDRMGRDTRDIEDWLIDHSEIADDLNWFLQIDISSGLESECTIDHDGDDVTITVNEDMSLSGSLDSCLSFERGGYWLGIDNDCLDEEFEISCDQDFVTALAYQRGNSGTTYISSETSSSTALGTTIENIDAKCFGENRCDYEGSLWAALALEKTGNSNVSQFLPYLLAFADENRKFFPSSFLFALTGEDDHYSDVVQLQQQDKFWDISGSKDRFYDTSLAMLSLGTTGASELNSAKNWLLEIQMDNGCWDNNNLRSTAFVLYSGWGRSVSGGSGGGSGGSNDCISAGNSCEIASECRSAGGNVLGNLNCEGFGFCCSVSVEEQSCSELGGEVCLSNEECDVSESLSAEGSCCTGTCIKSNVVNLCESFEGSCRFSCSSDEEESSESCGLDDGKVCCVSEGEPVKEGGISIWLIVILVVLIGIVILGIVKRQKLQIWLHDFRRGRESQGRGPRPGFPPGGLGRGRPMAPHGFRPGRSTPRGVPRRPVSRGDKEMDETLKRLKEIGK
jgi:hypothetical protein